VRRNPAPAGYVSNSEAVANEEPMRGLGQVRIHGAIEATGLVVVAVNRVLNLHRCVSWKASSQHLTSSDDQYFLVTNS
jgi:hypothetical protein